jgi:hypothetical protein
MFFLINNFPKTLLRMPFISKIKMAINYKEDNIFINLKDLKNAYIIIIVLLLKNVFRRRV